MAANPWTTGAETMMKSWSEAQKLMLESWGELAKTTAKSQSASDGNPFAGAAQEWQRLVERNLADWRRAGLAAEVAQRMVAGQGAFMQLLEQTADAWQALLPQLDTGGNWEKTLDDYLKRAQAQWFRVPTSLMQTSADSSALWTEYLQAWRKQGDAWLEPGKAQTPPGEVGQLMERFWSAFEQTFGRALQSPALGYGREFDAKLRSGFDAWLELRRAESDYHLLVADIWRQAWESLIKTLVRRAQEGKAPQSAKELLNLWIGVADDVFVREFGREAYIEAQGKLLNASMKHRLRERAIREVFMEAYGLPTRTELDETQQSLYELRRELRGLRRLPEEIETLKAERRETSEDQELAALKAELNALRQELGQLRGQGGPDRLEQNLPIGDYGELSVAEVSSELDGLLRYELEQVRAFELLHKNRKTLMQELDRRLQEGA